MVKAQFIAWNEYFVFPKKNQRILIAVLLSRDETEQQKHEDK